MHNNVTTVQISILLMVAILFNKELKEIGAARKNLNCQLLCIY